MTDTAKNTARRAESGAADVRRTVAPVGLVGKGLLYAALGFIAINVVVGSRDAGGTTKNGAIERVAAAPFGKFLMIVLAASLVALVVWKAMQAVAGDPVDGSEAKDRAKNGVKAFLYAGSAATAVSVLVANWSGGSSSDPQGGSGSDSGGSGGGRSQATAFVLDWPGGRFLVMIVGLGVIGYGGYQIYQQVIRTDFMDRIDPSLDEAKTKAIETVGRIGFAGRAVLMAATGLFLFIAGLDHEPGEAQGLSGILNDLSNDPLGKVALWVIAFGTFAYGVFALVESRHRRAY